jgi:hypothetical protein
MHMKNIMVTISLILMLYPISLNAEQGKSGPWEKVGEKDGIVAYIRLNPRAPVNESRSTCIINAPVTEVERVARDISIYKRFMFMSKKVIPIDHPDFKNTQDTQGIYLLQAFPWPVEDRDGVGRIDFYIQKSTNTILIFIKLLQSDYPPIPKKTTRIPFCEDVWILKSINSTTTELTYQVLMDPGGNLNMIPGPVTDYIAKYFGTYTCRNFRKIVEEGKYINSKEIITQTPLPDKYLTYLLAP